MISNINDIKIYTCNFTALVNILRHFCNSIDLLVSSALGNNRTLSFSREREIQKERNGTYSSYSHIYGSFLVSLHLGLSDTKDPLVLFHPAHLKNNSKQHDTKGLCISFAMQSIFYGEKGSCEDCLDAIQ